MIRSVELTPEEVRFLLEMLEATRMRGLLPSERPHYVAVLPKLQAALGNGDDHPWVDIESTNLKRVRYHVPSRRLDVEFNSGARWHYLDVPPSIWEGLQEAESKGRYFMAEIKELYTAVPEATPDDGAE